MDAATSFGRVLAENNIGLVYGGGSVGLMGALAEAVLDGGGRVAGVIPEFLVNREHMLLRVQERIVTRDMHERKRIMFERADAFVALPGGIGTLEELVEQLTWAQLGRHRKPILILNIEGFWDPLCALIDHMRRLDFIRADLSVRLLVARKWTRSCRNCSRRRAWSRNPRRRWCRSWPSGCNRAQPVLTRLGGQGSSEQQIAQRYGGSLR